MNDLLQCQDSLTTRNGFKFQIETIVRSNSEIPMYYQGTITDDNGYTHPSQWTMTGRSRSTFDYDLILKN